MTRGQKGANKTEEWMSQFLMEKTAKMPFFGTKLPQKDRPRGVNLK